MSTPIDHVALGLSRVTSEYQGQPNFSAYLTALLAPANNWETAGQAIAASIDIDTAVGVQLDLLGDVVGIGRNVPNAYPLPFFGYIDTPEGLPYGDDTLGGGGMWYNLGVNRYTTWSLDDPTYRKFIRARVVRNRSAGTLEDFISILQLIFPSDDIIVQDVEGQLRVAVGLGRITTATEEVILSSTAVLPKPAGVALAYIPYTQPLVFFGFNPTDKTYGDAVVGGGGPFSEDQY